MDRLNPSSWLMVSCRVLILVASRPLRYILKGIVLFEMSTMTESDNNILCLLLYHLLFFVCEPGSCQRPPEHMFCVCLFLGR